MKQLSIQPIEVVQLCIVLLCLVGPSCLSQATPSYAREGFTSKLQQETRSPFWRGIDLYQKGDLEGALNELTTAKGLEPKNVDIRRYLGAVYRRLHRFSEAEQEYQTVMLLEPDNLTNVLELAQLYLEGGKYQNSMGLYQQVLAKSPGNAEALMGLAMSLEGNNDLNNAADIYRELIAHHPNNSLAKSAQTRLDRLTKATKADSTNKFFPIDPDLGQAGLGWWDLTKTPLTVYVDSGEGVRGYREEMRNIVTKALNAWSNASQGAISFNLLSSDAHAEASWKSADSIKPILKRLEQSLRNVPGDPVRCDIHFHWTHNLASALGLAWTSRLKTGNPVLNKAHIWISTEKMADGTFVPLSLTPASSSVFESQDRMVEEVMMHELGHTLGLPHSSNPNDIMCSGIYGLNATDMVERRELSPRDILSLSEHYNNFEGTGMPANMVAQLRQDISPSAGSATPSGSGTGSSSTDGTAGGASDTGTTSETLAPFLPDTSSSGPAEESKPEEETKSEEESPLKDKVETTTPKYDPIRDALFALRTKQYDKSLSTLDKMLALNPHHPQAHYVKAVVYVMLRQYPQAALEYKEVLRLVPNSELSKKAQEGLKRINF